MNSDQQQPTTLVHRLNESITLKLVFIGALILLLLIPSAWIGSLISERAERQDQMINDVSDKWSGNQLIQGPVLVIPYNHIVKESVNGLPVTKTVIDNLFLLPDNLNINANINSEILHRGIFDAVVYNTTINISGNFLKADLEKLSISPEQLMPKKARFTFKISDLKGLKTNPQINLGNQELTAEPVLDDNALYSNGLQAAADLSGLTDKVLPFNFILNLKGSQELNFLHLGKTTTVTAKSNWTSPSFSGRYLPDSRHINKSGFTAKWRMLYYNRPFPQQWVTDKSVLDSMQNHQNAIFGVKLRIPVDQYQQTTRTNKYSVLIILLTFISLLLTELIGKKKIHIFNYLLIGLAMIIFYILLLSLSEQVGYTPAYIIAAIATIGLISAFIYSLLRNIGSSIIFALILSVFYTFIYIIIQLEDYALLVGSVALFITISMLMYFSRRINWENY